MNKIKEIRKKRGLTLTELAKKINMSVGNLSQIERGKVNLTQDNIDKLMSVLKVSVSELFGEQILGQGQAKSIKYTDSLTAMNLNESTEIFSIDEKFLYFLGIKNNFKYILVAKAPNNNMYPIIESGDTIFIDISEKKIVRDGLYVILEQGVIQIKKAIVDKENEKITISMTNKGTIGSIENNYKQEELTDKVFGRVILYTKNLF